MDHWTPDYQELLARDDVDAILVSLPIPLQADVARHALEAGKHVISEKPPGPDEPDAHELLAAADAHPEQVLLIAENYFYRDDVRWAKHLVERGEIGRVHMMAYREAYQLVPREDSFSSTPWRWQGAYRGGPHLDGGVHHTAKIRMIMGDVARLAAETQDANSTHGGPSDLVVTMRFVSEAIGTYAAIYPELAIPQEENEMRVYGTEGVLSVKNKRVELHRSKKTAVYDFPDQDGGYIGEFQNFHEAVVTARRWSGRLPRASAAWSSSRRHCTPPRRGKRSFSKTGRRDSRPDRCRCGCRMEPMHWRSRWTHRAKIADGPGYPVSPAVVGMVHRQRTSPVGMRLAAAGPPEPCGGDGPEA